MQKALNIHNEFKVKRDEHGSILLRLTYWKRDDGACGYIEQNCLYHFTKHNKDVQTTRIMQGDTADRILKSFESDIFIIPRMKWSCLIPRKNYSDKVRKLL